MWITTPMASWSSVSRLKRRKEATDMDANEQTMIWTQAYLQWLDGDADTGAEQKEQYLLRQAMRGEADWQRIAQALSEAENLLQAERGASEAAFDAVVAELHALAGKVMSLRAGAF